MGEGEAKASVINVTQDIMKEAQAKQEKGEENRELIVKL